MADIYTVGRCREMCPLAEAEKRKFEGRVHVLEMIQNKDTNSSNMVKEYRRSAAGRELCNPDELRPLEVLQTTMEHLLKQILPREDISTNQLHLFIEDRMRSILQDITIQRLCCVQSLGIVRHCFDYFVSSEYSLQSSSHATSGLTQQCGHQLLDLYSQHYDIMIERATWAEAASFQENRAEFTACFFLYNLDHVQVGSGVLSLPQEIRYHHLVQQSWHVYLAHMHNNYVRFFQLVQRLSHLLACAVHRHVIDMRKRALKVICIAYSSRNSRFPLGQLSRILAINSTEDTASLCALHGIKTEDGFALLTKTSFQKATKTEPGSHCSPTNTS